MSEVDGVEYLPCDDPAHPPLARGGPLVVVGTGPSYSEVDVEALRGVDLLLMNSAVTEHQTVERATWICPDIGRLVRRGHVLPVLRRYRRWRLVTRRPHLPGDAGAADWRGRGGVRISDRSDWILRPPRGSRIWWWSDFEDQPAHLFSGEGVLEAALSLATLHDRAPIVLVGVDLSRRRSPYARPWAWIPCRATEAKFEKMRASVAANRDRWPAEVYVWGGGWSGCPFPTVDAGAVEALLQAALPARRRPLLRPEGSPGPGRPSSPENGGGGVSGPGTTEVPEIPSGPRAAGEE